MPRSPLPEKSQLQDGSNSIQNSSQFVIKVEDINAMVEKYTNNLPRSQPTTAIWSSRETIVLLTGSTGNVGSHILASLLSDGRVDKVYTFNRESASMSTLDRLKASFTERDLPLKLLDNPKFVPLVGDITEDRFGLDESWFDEVQYLIFCHIS